MTTYLIHAIVFLTAVAVNPLNVKADIEILREIVIAPKNGHAGANVGPC